MKKNLQRLALTTLAAACLAAVLPACAPLLAGGAAVTALVAVDRRTSGTQLEDETIELKGHTRIGDALGSRVHVNVNSFNRQVLLTGEVPDEATKQTVEQIVSKLENVRGVINELAITSPTSLSQRSSDALVTGKVKATLVDARELTATAFRVVTERGIVYLMGRVTQREADRATALVRNVSGVNRVVRALEIISEDELAQINAQRQPAKSANPPGGAGQ